MLGDDVERSTPSLVVSVGAADHFGDDWAGLSPPRYDVPVVAVGGPHIVVRAECEARAKS